MGVVDVVPLTGPTCEVVLAVELVVPPDCDVWLAGVVVVLDVTVVVVVVLVADTPLGQVLQVGDAGGIVLRSLACCLDNQNLSKNLRSTDDGFTLCNSLGVCEGDYRLTWYRRCRPWCSGWWRYGSCRTYT